MYYGQFNPPVDKVLHKYLSTAQRGFFIECGAYDGVADSNCKFLEESFGWNGINIEASPTIYKKLLANRPNCTNLNYALSDYCGETNFTKCRRGDLEIGLGSIHSEVIDKSELAEEITVETIDWGYLCDFHIPTIGVDILSLDVENHELVVLKNILLINKYLPRVLCVEHGHVGQKNIIDLIDNKYKLLETYENNSIFALRV